MPEKATKNPKTNKNFLLLFVGFGGLKERKVKETQGNSRELKGTQENSRDLKESQWWL